MDSIDALEFAVLAHKGQKRRDGKPYIYHIIMVGNIVEQKYKNVLSSFDLEVLKCIAYLHDVIEDTPKTLSDLYNLYNQEIIDQELRTRVLNGVNSLTKRSDQTYVDYIMALKNVEDARKVKIADLTHNISDNLKPGHQKDKYQLALKILEEAGGK